MNIMTPEFRADPYSRYAELRHEHPVTQVEPSGLWAISRYEDVVHVLKNPQRFSSHGFKAAWQPEWVGYNPLANSMLALDGPSHARLRGLVSRAFGASAIDRIEPRLRQLAGELAEGLATQGEADFVSAFATPLPAFVIGELLGLDPSLQPHFKRWAEDIAGVTPAPESPEHAQRIRSTIEDLSRALSEVIAARRRAPAEDLVTELTRAELDGKSLSDREIVDFLVLLLIAGLETTTHLLASSALFLAQRPDELARVRADRTLVPKFVEELLRYESPVHAVARITTAAVTLAGVRVPAGAMVLALIGSANRDESHYPDPDRFDVHREQPALSFGHGLHFCIGAQLARLEARIGLEALLSRFRGFERTSEEIAWNRSLTVRGPLAVPLRFKPATSR